MLKLGLQKIVNKCLQKKLTLGTKKISEEDLTPIFREIRISLLNADVNLQVVKDFLNQIKEELLNEGAYSKNTQLDVLVFSTIKKKLISILGETSKDLIHNKNKVNKILLVGLNGSGKTTTTAKLSYYVKTKKNLKVKNVSLDIYRPGAYDQLLQLSNLASMDCVGARNKTEIKDVIRSQILKMEEEDNNGFIFFDNYGLLPDNEILLNDVAEIKKWINPQEVLFVIDAMSGQEILDTVKKFHEKIGITGLIVSKSDSNSPMGGVFSIAYMLNIPIKFLGTGEKLENLEKFYPDRIASVILGEGDILTLAEKLEENINVDSSKKMIGRLIDGKFDLNDLIIQIKEVRKMGPLKNFMSMIPDSNLFASLSKDNVDLLESQLRIWEIIIGSMTLKERKNPKLFKKQPNRKIRVIKGSGRKPDELNKLLKKWEESKKKIDELTSSFKREKSLFGWLFGK